MEHTKEHPMTATTMTLVEFLRARLDDDEAVARAVQPPGRPLEGGPLHWFATSNCAIGDKSGAVVAYAVEQEESAAHIARHDPARVLAEVEAKREIVDSCDTDGSQGPSHAVVCDIVLCALATIYRDHPDYRDEWKP